MIVRIPKTVSNNELFVNTIYIVIEHEFLKLLRNFENVKRNKFQISHEKKREYKIFLTDFIKKRTIPKLYN